MSLRQDKDNDTARHDSKEVDNLEDMRESNMYNLHLWKVYLTTIKEKRADNINQES